MRLPRWRAFIRSPRRARWPDLVDQWSAAGKKNIFGTTVKVCEMQSEGGAAGAVHGSLAAGAADHHLHRLPGPAPHDPQHVQDGRRAAAVRVPRERAHAGHQALSIFGDHSDVMACRQTGFAMLAETNVQEVMEPVRRGAPVRHQGPHPLHQLLRRLPHLARSAEDRRVGLRGTSPTCATWEAVSEFRDHALNPSVGHARQP